MISTSFVALHINQSLTLVEYLVPVLLYLLIFTGIGLSLLWGFRLFGIASSRTHGRGENND